MAELLLKSEQAEQLKEILKVANAETKFVCCFIDSITMEQKFDVIVQLLKNNDYKELFDKMKSKAPKSASELAINICSQNGFSWFRFISDCEGVTGFLHEDCRKEFLRKVYGGVSFDELKELVGKKALFPYSFFANVMPSENLLDFLSYEYDGKSIVSLISIEQWIDKFSGEDAKTFIGLCLEKGNSQGLVRYSANCGNTRQSVDNKRVETVFQQVPENLKIRFLLGLYDLCYNGSMNVFGYEIADCDSNYYKELGYMNILSFVENIEKERWLELLLSKVSVLAREPKMLFERLTEKDLIYFIKYIPFDDLKKLTSYVEFDVRIKNANISKSVNDRFEGKSDYSLASLIG